MDPHLQWSEYQMADSKRSEHARRRAEAKAAGDPGKAARSGEKDQKEPSDKAPEPRRVPGLHGYDPSQWPDAGL